MRLQEVEGSAKQIKNMLTAVQDRSMLNPQSWGSTAWAAAPQLLLPKHSGELTDMLKCVDLRHSLPRAPVEA